MSKELFSKEAVSALSATPEERAPKPIKMQTDESLINPTAQGQQNAAIAAAVQEAVKAVFEGLAPMMEKMALTPEKLRDAQKPYVDPAAIARELRERQNMKEQDAETRRNTAERQANCSHQDKNQHWSISVVHNFPDRMPRGICVVCHKFFEPRCWKIGAPTAENPKGKAFIQDADPQYYIIKNIEAMS